MASLRKQNNQVIFVNKGKNNVIFKSVSKCFNKPLKYSR